MKQSPPSRPQKKKEISLTEVMFQSICERKKEKKKKKIKTNPEDQCPRRYKYLGEQKNVVKRKSIVLPFCCFPENPRFACLF